MHHDRRHIAASAELVSHPRGNRICFIVDQRAGGLDSQGGLQLQSTPDRIYTVAADITQSTGSEIPPAAPFERRIGRMIWPLRRRAEPQVPIQRIRHSRRILGSSNTLGPIHIGKTPQGPVGPNMHLAHGADRATPDILTHQAGSLGGLAIIAHLGRHPGFSRGLGNHAGLVHRVRQRLFAIDMLASLDSRH